MIDKAKMDEYSRLLESDKLAEQALEFSDEAIAAEFFGDLKDKELSTIYKNLQENSPVFCSRINDIKDYISEHRIKNTIEYQAFKADQTKRIMERFLMARQITQEVTGDKIPGASLQQSVIKADEKASGSAKKSSANKESAPLKRNEGPFDGSK